MIKQLLYTVAFLIVGNSYAQEICFLGIGGKDDATIKEVFQLNENQIEKLVNWGAELKFRNEVFEIKLENLLKNHAQSSPEDLLKMSYKYKAYLDSIDANMRLLDKRMLGTFNKEQYNLYVQFCNHLSRSPIYTARPVNE